MTRLSLLIGTVLAFHALALYAGQPDSVFQYELLELRFESDSTYAHPIYDVAVWARFQGPHGQSYRIRGFWDGADQYVVRFAPNAVGSWTWSTECSDSSNAGLHDKEGQVSVGKNANRHRFDAHGWIRPSRNGRYLQHDDGTPFFYLAGTAWEITVRSFLPEVKQYASDRRSKGFTACQLVAMSHLHIQEFGVVNRNGDSSLIKRDLSRLNPEYFRYLDSVVTTLNDSGLMVSMAPLWGSMAYLYRPGPHRFHFSHEQAMSLARYVGARYAGHNVLWIVGGDASYETPERRSFWRAFAHALDSASGGMHTVTAHTGGWRGSWDYFGYEDEWLDVQMYHSSHTADGDFTWAGGLEGISTEPPKPVINGEGAYEDLYHNLDDANQRMDASYTRQAAYESVLSGSLGGYAYGVNGVWQWANGEDAWPFLDARYTALEAIHLPGSFQMQVMKNLMTEFDWYRLRPREELVWGYPWEAHISCSAYEDTGLAYIWRTSHVARFDFSSFGDSIELQWINPATGVRGETFGFGETQSSILSLERPDTNDWLLFFRSVEPRDTVYINSSFPYGESLFQTQDHRRILVRLEGARDLPYTVSVHTMHGESAFKESGRVPTESFRLLIEDLPTGTYLVRTCVLGANSGSSCQTRKFVVISE